MVRINIFYPVYGMVKKLVILCLWWLTFVWCVWGFTIPQYQWYVTDMVGIFSSNELSALQDKITTIQKATGIEIAVLVVPTVQDDINLAAADVWNTWWVGQKWQNNGLVVLIALEDKQWSIQVGYGLEATLPDIVTKKIGETHFPVHFKAGNYYEWISAFLDDVWWYIQKDPTLVQNYTVDTHSARWTNDDVLWYFLLFFFVVLGSFWRIVTTPTLDGKKRKMKKYGRWIYMVSGLLWGFILIFILANILLSLVVSYGILLISILVALSRKWPGSWPLWFWWFGSGGGWSRWGWFGWFGWGSFGGWWSSWSR